MTSPAVRESALRPDLPEAGGDPPAAPEARDAAWAPDSLRIANFSGSWADAGGRATVDLRPRRDLFDRRRWRERGRSVTRALGLMIGDASAAGVALLIASVPFGGSEPWAMAATIPLVALLLVLFQAAAGTYGPGTARRKYERAIVYAAAAAAAFLWLGHSYGLLTLSPARAAVFVPLLGGLICGVRVLADAAVRRMRRLGWGTTPTLIIGEAPRALEITAHVKRRPNGHVQIVGWVAPSGGLEVERAAVRNGRRGGAGEQAAARDHTGNGAGPRPLGSLSELGEVLESHDVRSVIISANLAILDLKRILNSCLLHGCSVGLVPHALNELPSRVTPRDFLGWPLLELEVPRLHLVQTLAKRGLDLALSAVALVLLAPLLVGIAIAVRLDSPGPALFRQRRLGVGGRRFTIYKYRTMREDAEQLLKENPELLELYHRNDFKLPADEDPRITRLGAFLRRTSLDELPQLLNVLTGHMSLVGPRPIVPDEIGHYGEEAPVFLAVKPGVTGYWQVNGRSSIGYPERADLDVEYIRHWSMLSDLRILFRTVRSVLRREGAF